MINMNFIISLNSILVLIFISSNVNSFNINPAVLEQHFLGNDVNAWNLIEEDNPEHILTSRDLDNAKPPEEMIVDAGYPSETHTVVTKDGYILTIHRIPHGKGDSYNNKRPTVFLMHGLLSSSADWILTGPDKALSFLLSDSGYDVWMGNYRGNTYSNKHINSTLDPATYWAFSWDEMAEHDLPTMLAHMQEVTGQRDFFYIGHSMGTLTYFTACNYNPWIANSTKLMVGYGSHTRVPHMISPVFKLLAYYEKDVKWILDHFGVNKFLPSTWLTAYLAAEVCTLNMFKLNLCGDMLFLMCGYNQHEMNDTMLPTILGHGPAGTSVRNMLHYSQSVNTGAWAGFDMGTDEKNMKRWNSTHPPDYRYDVITAPVALYWAQNDWLVVPKDEADLANRLPNLIVNQKVPEPSYTHTDFIWGIHSRELVYQPTLKLMRDFL